MAERLYGRCIDRPIAAILGIPNGNHLMVARFPSLLAAYQMGSHATTAVHIPRQTVLLRELDRKEKAAMRNLSHDHVNRSLSGNRLVLHFGSLSLYRYFSRSSCGCQERFDPIVERIDDSAASIIRRVGFALLKSISDRIFC